MYWLGRCTVCQLRPFVRVPLCICISVRDCSGCACRRRMHCIFGLAIFLSTTAYDRRKLGRRLGFNISFSRVLRCPSNQDRRKTKSIHQRGTLRQ
ncbi:unnamed protein product, partial [Ectocarpus sp. 13 AM-2016]